MPAQSIILILGSGPRVGAGIAAKFHSLGYKVALASRKGASTNSDFLAIKADLSDSSIIPSLYEQVIAHFGAAPNVVVYNAASLTPPAKEGDLFSIPAAGIARDFEINTTSAFVAAREAIKVWSLPESANDTRAKRFIYTGNASNRSIAPIPLLVNLGMGKAASAYWVGVADALYRKQGIRFFYADERNANGERAGLQLDGAAHGEFYAVLAGHGGDGSEIPWEATFVKGVGYKHFA